MTDKIHNTEDKDYWVEKGRELEDEFVQTVAPVAGLDARINPAKDDDKYAPDLLVDGELADLKTQHTPFFTAGKYGIQPHFCVTFNTKDKTRYVKKYGDLPVYFWVKFEAGRQYGAHCKAQEGVWLGYAAKMLGPVHKYKRRGGQAEWQNASGSMLIDLRDLEQIWVPSENLAADQAV